ncbi:MAG: hypothetical protein ACI96W_001378 [Paraglaciecola sp.]|jgi:hypothetical protein
MASHSTIGYRDKQKLFGSTLIGHLDGGERPDITLYRTRSHKQRRETLQQILVIFLASMRIKQLHRTDK